MAPFPENCTVMPWGRNAADVDEVDFRLASGEGARGRWRFMEAWCRRGFGAVDGVGALAVLPWLLEPAEGLMVRVLPPKLLTSTTGGGGGGSQLWSMCALRMSGRSLLGELGDTTLDFPL